MTGSPQRPRRRADDWRTTSDVPLDRHWFNRIAMALNYDPREVESIRINRNEVTIILNATAVRHRMIDS